MSRAATSPRRTEEAPAPRPRPSGKACIHHWQIESPNGRESMGTCKRCGAQKSFSNSTESVMWEQTNTLRSDHSRSGWRSSKASEYSLADEA
jgi:hypothetical protein